MGKTHSCPSCKDNTFLMEDPCSKCENKLCWFCFVETPCVKSADSGNAHMIGYCSKNGCEEGLKSNYSSCSKCEKNFCRKHYHRCKEINYKTICQADCIKNHICNCLDPLKVKKVEKCCDLCKEKYHVMDHACKRCKKRVCWFCFIETKCKESYNHLYGFCKLCLKGVHTDYEKCKSCESIVCNNCVKPISKTCVQCFGESVKEKERKMKDISKKIVISVKKKAEDEKNVKNVKIDEKKAHQAVEDSFNLSSIMRKYVTEIT